MNAQSETGGPSMRRPRRARSENEFVPLKAAIEADFQLVRADFTLTVAFDLEPGATLAVVGPNGSGKSTLLSALAGHTPVTSGAIRIGTRAVDDPLTGTFVRPEDRAVAFVHQEPLLFPHLTVRANVEFGLRAQKVHSRRLLAEAALAAVGMLDYADSKPAELSGGQAQRVSLARGLVLQRSLLLLDEPLSKVDVSNRRTIRKSLQEQGQTQVIVTHGPEHARECDRVLAIDNGVIVALATPDALIAEPPTAWLKELFQ